MVTFLGEIWENTQIHFVIHDIVHDTYDTHETSAHPRSYKSLENEMSKLDTNEDVFYVRNSSVCETVGNSSVHSTQPANSFTNSISRRRKLTQSLSGISSPVLVRNKLSPVREYVPSNNSNAGSPTTPTNPMVCSIFFRRIVKNT